MKKKFRFVIILICFGGLVSVRAFVEPFLYDPFINYFKGDYLKEPFPLLNYSEYFLNISYRYWLNVLFSLGIIYAVFNKKETTIFALNLFLISFAILIVVLFCLLKYEITTNYLVVFYIRRFLIHPIILLLLIPAFFYQLKNIKLSK